MTKKMAVEKGNVFLEKLEVKYLPIDSIKPNSYNPNRQSAHDFELLCKSVAADGFTQPIVVQEDTLEIVDGEHRWRVCKALGYDEIPCVLTKMTPEQMRIATLRHNRARGSEDADLAADVLKELLSMGGMELAQDELMMDDVEVQRLMADLGDAEVSKMDIEVPEGMLGPSGGGQSDFDKAHNIDLTADRTRAKERILATAKGQEEKDMAKKDSQTYRLVLFFTGEEAKAIKAVLDQGEGPAANLLALCKEESAA